MLTTSRGIPCPSPPAVIYLSVVPPANILSLPVAISDDYDVISGEGFIASTLEGLLANDQDSTGDPLRVKGSTKPAHGTLVLDSDGFGGFSYTPTDGYVGPDSFSYRVYHTFDAYFSSYVTVSFDVKAALPIVTGLTITKAAAGIPGSTGSATVQITSANAFRGGAPIELRIGGHQVGSGLSNANGSATIAFTLPSVSGKHNLEIVSGTKSVATTITVASLGSVVAGVSFGLPTGTPSQTVYLVAKVSSFTAVKAGIPVAVYLSGKKVATKTTDATGTAKVALKLPALAGKYEIRVVTGAKTASRIIILGKGLSAKLGKLKTVKAKKIQTISGSFGAAAGKVVITVTDPKGTVTSKVVSLNSKGKFSYRYKTGSKGGYKVGYSYRASAKYYGARSYTAAFRVK